MKQTLLAIAALAGLASCVPSTTLTENEKITVTKDVNNTLHNYYADIKKWGLTAEFKYLDSTSDFFWTPPGFATSISYDSVAALLKQNAPNYKLVDNTFDTLKIVPLSKELAAYTGRLYSRMTDTAGKTMTFKLVETGVLIKRKDGWKLLSGQTTMLNP